MSRTAVTTLVPPRYLPDDRDHRARIVDSIARILSGKTNNTGIVTLAASTVATDLHDPRIGAFSHLDFMPETANSALEKKNIYITNRGDSTATINHSSTSTTDRSFTYLVTG